MLTAAQLDQFVFRIGATYRMIPGAGWREVQPDEPSAIGDQLMTEELAFTISQRLAATERGER